MNGWAWLRRSRVEIVPVDEELATAAFVTAARLEQHAFVVMEQANELQALTEEMRKLGQK